MSRRFLYMALVCAALLCGATSCMSDRYLTFDDDEWSGAAIDGDRALANGELEMDDWDR